MPAPQPKNPAETYESYFVPAMFRPWASLLLEHAALEPGARVLDLASGTGVVARAAAPLVGEHGSVTAVDTSEAMLAVARSLPPVSGAPISWRAGDALALPFPDASFDALLCQHGLPFFSDRPSAAREMRRVLRSGGRASVIVLQALGRHALFEALMKSVARALAVPLAAVQIPFASCDAQELRALFRTAGFARVTIHEVTTEVRFPEPERFVPLAVQSSAAAVPAFAALEAPAKAALVASVAAELEATLRAHRSDDHIRFPMYAHIALATA